MEATDRLNVVIMPHQHYSGLLIKNYRLEREERNVTNLSCFFPMMDHLMIIRTKTNIIEIDFYIPTTNTFYSLLWVELLSDLLNSKQGSLTKSYKMILQQHQIWFDLFL